MGLKLTPLEAPHGVLIEGVDLSQRPDQSLASEIRSAIHKYLVVIFPNQTFSAQQQLEFAKTLGPLRRREMPKNYIIPVSSKETPGISYVSNIRDKNGNVTGVIPDGEMWFHHDTCYTEEPDKFTMLYGVTIPKEGGNTMWSNMYLAWKTLPGSLKQILDGKLALNVYDYATIERPDLSKLEQIEHAWQPSVICHPVTGKKALFVNRLMTCQIEGMSVEKSADILSTVFDHAEQEKFVYEHSWTASDFIVWDNLAVTHARKHFALGDDRKLRRSKVSGHSLTH